MFTTRLGVGAGAAVFRRPKKPNGEEDLQLPVLEFELALVGLSFEGRRELDFLAVCEADTALALCKAAAHSQRRPLILYQIHNPDRLCGPCLLYTSPSPRDKRQSRMPSSA